MSAPCRWCFACGCWRSVGEWGRFRPLLIAVVVFAVLAFLLAMGEYGRLYRLQSLVPLVNRFRFPCRAIVLVQLCIARSRRRWRFALFARALRVQSDRRSARRDEPYARRVGVSVALGGRRTAGLAGYVVGSAAGLVRSAADWQCRRY